ncbi:MAG: hypothetical protein AAGH15_04975 [Myxococcota bacterium]
MTRTLSLLALLAAACGSTASGTDLGAPDATTPDAATEGGTSLTDAAPRDEGVDAPVVSTRLFALPGGVHGVAVDAEGRVLVADTFRSRTLLRSEPGLAEPLAATGFGSGQPAGLRYEGETLFVADTLENAVLELDAALTLVARRPAPAPWNTTRLGDGDRLAIGFAGELVRLGEPGESAEVLFGGLDAPFDLAPAAEGGVWISEQGAGPGRVARWSLAGERLETLEHPGGAWANPEGLVVDAAGDLWIAETERGEVLRLRGGAVRVEARIELPVALTRHPEGGVLVAHGGASAGLVWLR